jgi:hypothetical protein
MKVTSKACPGCLAVGMRVFYEVDQVPVNSVLLLNSREEALEFQRGRISLAVCAACGFISNIAFDPTLTQYSARYEATQGYSPTFNKFHRRLAQDLITRYDLHGKNLIEIGCDKGDFLTMLCEMGDNRGIGFDPAYVPGRHPSAVADQLTFIADYYSETYSQYRGDFICCKMTLEHIPDVGDFVGMVRRSIGDDPNSVVFFQIPNARYVLRDVAFWDIYYEHCSYFTKGSLARLFSRAGFDILDLWTDYDDQYLMIEARPYLPQLNGSRELELESVGQTLQDVDYFVANYTSRREQWRKQLAAIKTTGEKLVLWGGGSKGVAFLTTLGLTLNEVQYVVDINPNKTGTFMAGTGQEIVAPDFLAGYRPDVVVIMNPVYRQEITQDLAAMSLSPRILTM